MKYYLGKSNKGKYEPINCINEDDILSVINFTSRFEDEISLRSDLIDNGLINGDERLAYIYKIKDSYKRIPNGENLTFSYAKEYNTSNGLYTTLIKEKYNKDLYIYLAKMISNKYYGTKNHIAERANILEVMREVLYANEIGVDKYEHDITDKRKLNLLILKFLKSSIGIYDSKTKKYQMTEGKIDTNKRKMVDLILILNAYYNELIKENIYEIIDSNNEEKKTQYEEIEDYDKEEFLTDEDFENFGMNPENFRHLIRERR